MSLEEVRAALESLIPMAGRLVVVGVGNEISADDGAGPLVARMLTEASPCFPVIDAGTMPENFVPLIARYAPSHVIIVDAAVMEGASGEVALVSSKDLDDMVATTHHIPLRRVVERIIDRCGCKVLVIGINPATIEMGESVSAPVSSAAAAVAGLLLELCGRVQGRTTQD